MKYSQKRFINGMGNLPMEPDMLAGYYGIPRIQPEAYQEGIRFIGFNWAKSCTERGEMGVHFFLDDYQFERIWAMPVRYCEMLKDFKAVLTPDFSLYTDWPKAMQIWNHFRKHYIGAMLQKTGARVYPSICWSDAASYKWCFSGEPVGGCVAVSSVGTQKSRIPRQLFLMGYDAMLERLRPEVILFNGDIPKECRGNIVPIEAHQNKFREG